MKNGTPYIHSFTGTETTTTEIHIWGGSVLEIAAHILLSVVLHVVSRMWYVLKKKYLHWTEFQCAKQKVILFDSVFSQTLFSITTASHIPLTVTFGIFFFFREFFPIPRFLFRKIFSQILAPFSQLDPATEHSEYWQLILVFWNI